MKDVSITTLNELLTEYLEYIRGLNYSEKTAEEVFYDIREFMKFLSGKDVKTPAEIKRTDLMNYQKYLTNKRTRKGLHLKPRTLNKKISLTRSYLKYLVKKGYILNALPEVLQDVKMAKMLPMGILKHKNIEKIITKVDTTTSWGYRDRTMLELLYTSAIRAGELLGLNTKDVDFDNGTVTVFGKGKKERVVPVGKTALRFLETYIKGIRPYLLKEKTEALFISRRGQRLCYESLREMVHRYSDGAKIEKNVTPHVFRRSCTTELIRGGANLYHVKDMLGHESLDTLKHYAKLTIADLKKTHRKCHPREQNA